MMKPKGIEIFQHDLMSRDESKLNDEKPTTYIAVENQVVTEKSVMPNEIHVRDSAKMSAFNIDPKSSIFTSSNQIADNSLVIDSANRNLTKDTARDLKDKLILGELSSAMNSHEAPENLEVSPGFKKMRTTAPKKKKKETIYSKTDLAEMTPS